MKIYKVISSDSRVKEDGMNTHVITKDVCKAVWIAQRVFIQRLDSVTYLDVYDDHEFKLAVLEADVKIDPLLDDWDVEITLDALIENGCKINWRKIAGMGCLE